MSSSNHYVNLLPDSEESLEAAKYALDVRDRIDSLKDMLRDSPEETELTLPHIEAELDEIIARMNERPDIFEKCVQEYQKMREDLIPSINRFLSSSLEGKLTLSSSDLCPRESPAPVTRADYEGVPYLLPGDDLPF